MTVALARPDGRALVLPGAAILGGIAATGIVAAASGLSRTRLALLAAVVVVAFLVALTRRPEHVLLPTWLLALTYNRQFFSFEGLVGDLGSQGPYWIAADGVLVLLAATVLLRRERAFPGVPWWPWVLPFLVAATWSVPFAIEPVWAAAELARLAKVAVAAVVLRAVIARTGWWVAVWALALAIAVQSLLGIAQTVLNTGTNLSALVGGGEGAGVAFAVGEGAGRTRAAGTMAHPNVLAPWLVLVLPAYLALAVAARDPRRRAMGLVIAALGAGAIACSLSRAPMVLLLAAAALVLALAVRAGRLPLGRALSIAVLGTVLLVGAALPFAPMLAARFKGDLGASVDFRADYNRAALVMTEAAPVTGVGLNNFRARLPEVAPLYASILAEQDENRRTANVKVWAPVHNLYLLILSETGLLGFAGLLVLLAGVAVHARGAWRATAGDARLVVGGIAIGLLLMSAQQQVDFSAWSDPTLHTLAFLCVLLATAMPTPGQGTVTLTLRRTA